MVLTLKSQYRSWGGGGSGVEGACCSWRRLEWGSQNPCEAAGGCLTLQPLQGIWYLLLVSVGTYIHVDTWCTYNQKYTLRKSIQFAMLTEQRKQSSIHTTKYLVNVSHWLTTRNKEELWSFSTRKDSSQPQKDTSRVTCKSVSDPGQNLKALLPTSAARQEHLGLEMNVC